MAQYEQVNVRGYREFCKAVADRPGKDIFAYFSGDKDEKGNSWCPDCVRAEPIIKGAMSSLPQGSVFIYCQVGERNYKSGLELQKEGVDIKLGYQIWVRDSKFYKHSWKDSSNEFKTTLKLTGVPTLLRYNTPQKLVEEECFKEDLVKMMFTED